MLRIRWDRLDIVYSFFPNSPLLSIHFCNLYFISPKMRDRKSILNEKGCRKKPPNHITTDLLTRKPLHWSEVHWKHIALFRINYMEIALWIITYDDGDDGKLPILMMKTTRENKKIKKSFWNVWNTFLCYGKQWIFHKINEEWHWKFSLNSIIIQNDVNWFEMNSQQSHLWHSMNNCKQLSYTCIC